MNVFKLSTINNLNIYFLFIFSNYFIYFCFKEKLFFLFFSILIILVFLFTIIKNFKENKLIISIFILFCLISLSSPVADWDARSIWLFNAKIIFFESSLGNYFSYSPYYNHIDYPIFVPVLSATLATIINGWNEIFPKFSTLILALPPLIILSKISKKFLSKLVLLILILFIYEKRIINGEVDAILALYSILLIELLKNFFNIKKENNPSFGHLIIILFNIIFLTLIKFEGSVIALTILASFFFTYRDKISNLKVLIPIVIIAFIPILLWLLYSNTKIDTSSAGQMLSGGERFLSNLLDFKFILHLVGKILINKQMMIVLIVFVFIFAKYISVNMYKINCDKLILRKEFLFCYLSIINYSVILSIIMIMSEGSTHNVQQEYFMANTASDRYFAPVHSMILLCSIYLIENSKKARLFN
jgi:hypothetical protein